MSGRRERALRQAARTSPQRNVGNRHRTGVRHRGGRRRWSWLSWNSGLIALGAVAVLAVILILPRLAGTSSTQVPSEAKLAAQLGVAEGTGLPVGTTVPTFSGQDVVSGETITSASIYAHKTLLFFSEGVMCEACLQQIQGLQQVGSALEQRGIQLVSITPDSSSSLTTAAQDYGITAPLIPDPSRTISSAFNTLGLGMHANTPGHAFVLVYQGKVLWYRDYYQPPYSTMNVAPQTLLAAIPND
jgi:peroxiredoxin Q/BCP